ncbi:serine/threonine protein kinase, partial [Candidatus Obscuribacterales bacterium]|nr:serine/threonine protein kinase [Candidatus Obscuribacterales bacterium]
MDEGNNLKAKSMAMTGGSDAQESRALSDNYVIIGPLAETAHSVVEIIREIDTGHHLLAKVLKESSPEVQERFHQAILEHGRLQHKNIVQTVDWRISESGEPVFITEFLEGVNLDQLIDEVGTLEDDEEITTFLIQVCDALEYAHSEGMMHGGLTPANIVITQPDESILVKIADFGFTNSSRELPENPDRLRATYMAPEQLKGEITEKSDVFSVAAVAYQLITGFLPYGTEGDGTQLSPIGEYRPDIPEAEKLSFVLERALQLDPDERTSSIRDFKRGVREWYQSIGDEEDEAA